MSLRELCDMQRVLCPTLVGTYYFSIIGSQGYGYGILAHSLQGFKHTAMRMATSEGFDKTLGLTATILASEWPQTTIAQRYYWDGQRVAVASASAGDLSPDWDLHSLGVHHVQNRTQRSLNTFR